MLIFGASVSDWQEKSRYAQDKADNEYAKLHEVRCAGIEDVDTAFAAMAAFAAGTKCKKFLYHATINLNPGERLTREQWQKAVDALEKNLNLTGHDRVVFEHIKKGRQHYHIVWSRIDPATGKAVHMSRDYSICGKTAAALEKKFGLKTAPRKGKKHHKRWESERGNRSGIDPEIVRKEVTAIFHASKTSKEFVTRLEKAGYTLTRGRDDKYVLVDKKGDIHGLVRRIEGVKLAEVSRKFPDLKTVPLPSLSSILKNRRQTAELKVRKKPIKRAFRRAGRSITKRARPVMRRIGVRRINQRRPAFKLRPGLAALITRIRQSFRANGSTKPDIMFYPMRRHGKRKKYENIPDSERVPFRRPEWDAAELLAWAFANGRYDILASFGIHIAPDDQNLYDQPRFE